jgi:glycosyltransferase involved in cell wall biosynthesis
MSVSRRLLVLVYDYPPSPSVGAARWWTLTNYLAQMGHSVTVVTSDSFGAPTTAEPVQVVRPRSLETSWPFRRLRHVNPRVGWAPSTFREARRILGEQTFDCLITTSPPESAHLVGLMLGRRRPAWVADFRDGWCFEPYTVRFRTRALLALDCWLERRVGLAAELTVGATPPIADDLARRLGARARWIPNGWDPVAAVEDAGTSPMPAGAGLALVYTGRLSGLLGRTPEALFRALKLLESKSQASSAFRFVHAGPLTAEDRILIERTGVSELVEHLGSLDRASALALQRAADVLVLITSRNSSEATGKLFEYLAAGRPILALAEGNEAERIVQETQTGMVVAPDDVDAIADALRRAAVGELERDYAPRGIERYSYPGLAEEAVDAIEQAIAIRKSI